LTAPLLKMTGDPMADYSETLMEHFQSPSNMGRMESPDCVGTAGTPGQGRFIILYLRIADERIERAQFECNGCGVTVAVSSVLTELVEGRTIAECLALRPTDISEALDGIPPYKADCAHYAITALRNAFEQQVRVADQGAIALKQRQLIDSRLVPSDQRATMTIE
jgi:nitrogen fixation protein NifU and related proteins